MTEAKSLRDAISGLVLSKLSTALAGTGAQLRKTWDVSEERDEYPMVVVSVSDSGDHPGCLGGILKDGEITVDIAIRFDVDTDGAVFDSTVDKVYTALAALRDEATDDWAIRHCSFTLTHPTATDQSYRTATFSASCFFQKLN